MDFTVMARLIIIDLQDGQSQAQLRTIGLGSQIGPGQISYEGTTRLNETKIKKDGLIKHTLN